MMNLLHFTSRKSFPIFLSCQSYSSRTQNYYEILGLDKKCSQADIKSAFVELSKKYHPDVASPHLEDTQRRFQELNAAYSTLSRQQQRTAYDLSLHQGDTPRGPQNPYNQAYYEAYSRTYNHAAASERGQQGHEDLVPKHVAVVSVVVVVMSFALGCVLSLYGRHRAEVKSRNIAQELQEIRDSAAKRTTPSEERQFLESLALQRRQA